MRHGDMRFMDDATDAASRKQAIQRLTLFRRVTVVVFVFVAILSTVAIARREVFEVSSLLLLLLLLMYFDLQIKILRVVEHLKGG